MKRISQFLCKYQFTASQTKIPLSLVFPYEYTLMPQQFILQDARFTQLSMIKHLSDHENNHIKYVIGQFENMLNSKKCSEQFRNNYLRDILKQKVEDFQNILKEAAISLNFKFNTESKFKSVGYMQILPLNQISLEQNIKFIHEYSLNRSKQILKVSQKYKRSKLSQEQQYLKDTEKQQNQRSRMVQQNLKNVKGKNFERANQILDFLSSIGKNKKEVSKFDNYYVIDQIKGTFNCQMIYKNQIYSGKDISLIRNESEDLKNIEKELYLIFNSGIEEHFFLQKILSKILNHDYFNL